MGASDGLATMRLELLQGVSRSMDTCPHFDQIRDVTPSGNGCEECLKTGDDWVHLRLCLSCGHVGCCDESRNKHASRHFRDTGHPMIQSFEPGETWAWCFVDRAFFDRLPAGY
jgi:uncharacterized UBP type Zn finger protein